MKWKLKLQNLKTEQLIFWFALVFGSLYLLVTPPFQVPDSPNHFYRAFQLSEGNISPINENKSVGGYIPKSFDSLQKRFSKYRYNAYAKMRKDEYKELAAIELNQGDQVFAHFPNTAVYSPVSYVPQTLAMILGKQMNMNPLSIVYLVKVFSFACWMMLMFFALKFLPIKKLLFGILMLLPMSLFINSSFSADMMINGLSWLYLAIVLNLALTKRVVSTKMKGLLLVLIILIGLSKLVYIPIVFVLLLIPSFKFNSKFNLILFFIVSGVLGGGSAMLWKKHIDSFYTSYLDYNPAFRDNITLGYKADMNKQMDFIKANKVESIQIFAQSYVREFEDNFSSYIGNLGWNRFMMPTWFILLAYAIIVFFAFTHTSDTYFLSVKQKLILGWIVFSSTGLVMLSQYLTWNPVGHNEVWPLMGRYFTPIYPLLFLLCSNSKIKVSSRWYRTIFLVYSVIACVYSVWRMDDSFYVKGEHKLAWQYDFSTKDAKSLTQEHVEDNVKINANNPPILIDSLAGHYHVPLTAKNPFAYTVSLFKVKKGDKVEVSCWKTEDAVKFVFDDSPESKYYIATCFSSKLMEGDFEYVTEVYFCKEDFEELKVYLYNPIGGGSFARDYSIKYYKNY